MILVVDTNRIIAALIKDSYSRKIILSDKFELVTVNFSKKMRYLNIKITY